MLACLYANSHRDTTKRPHPFEIEDFMPKYSGVPRGTDRETPYNGHSTPADDLRAAIAKVALVGGGRMLAKDDPRRQVDIDEVKRYLEKRDGR